MGSTVTRDVTLDEEIDGDQHEVKLAVTCFMRVAGMECYHTSVIVDDHEYFFDSLGIMVAPPLWSHLQAGAKTTAHLEVLDYGTSSVSGRAMAETLRPYFFKDSYDLLYKNCNHFSDLALYALNKSRLEGRISRTERFLTCTEPLSTNLMNKLFQALIERRTGEPYEAEVYTTNPNAVDFDTDQVIRDLDDMDEDSSEDEDAYYIGCHAIRKAPCCQRNAKA